MAGGVKEPVAGNSKRFCAAHVVHDRCQLGLGSEVWRPWLPHHALG